MSRRKSNKRINITKDSEKSYVFIDEGNKNIGILMWHYIKKRWVFDDLQTPKKSKLKIKDKNLKELLDIKDKLVVYCEKLK